MCKTQRCLIPSFSNPERSMTRVPLAPYLFLIMAKGLNAMVVDKAREGRIQGISLSSKGDNKSIA